MGHKGPESMWGTVIGTTKVDTRRLGPTASLSFYCAGSGWQVEPSTAPYASSTQNLTWGIIGNTGAHYIGFI